MPVCFSYLKHYDADHICCWCVQQTVDLRYWRKVQEAGEEITLCKIAGQSLGSCPIATTLQEAVCSQGIGSLLPKEFGSLCWDSFSPLHYAQACTCMLIAAPRSPQLHEVSMHLAKQAKFFAYMGVAGKEYRVGLHDLHARALGKACVCAGSQLGDTGVSIEALKKATSRKIRLNNGKKGEKSWTEVRKLLVDKHQRDYMLDCCTYAEKVVKASRWALDSLHFTCPEHYLAWKMQACS